MKEIQQGFSLSQLVFTIMMVGILTSIAYPSYQKYVENTKLRPLQNSPKSPKFPPRHLGDFP